MATRPAVWHTKDVKDEAQLSGWSKEDRGFLCHATLSLERAFADFYNLTGVTGCISSFADVVLLATPLSCFACRENMSNNLLSSAATVRPSWLLCQDTVGKRLVDNFVLKEDQEADVSDLPLLHQ